MSTYFVDSSALVKKYQHETGSDRVLEILDNNDGIVISRLTELEVTAALVRRARVTGTSLAQIDSLVASFDRDLQHAFDIVELNAAVIRRASELARLYFLRAADSIQLASAVLAAGGSASAALILVSSDQELNSAATAAGLAVLDPTQP
jgi:predicted nucleic acid-binding protein